MGDISTDMKTGYEVRIRVQVGVSDTSLKMFSVVPFILFIGLGFSWGNSALQKKK